MTPAVFMVLFISLSVAIVFATWVIARHLGASRRAMAELVSGKEYRGLSDQYRGLTDEYRRLSDMAITAQEHTDLRLTDISVRIDDLRDQLEQMRRILKEVE
jgi:hypothetical protein